MQWDRNYSSSEIDDRRGEGGVSGFGGGGGGGGAFLIFRILSMFGWKGMLVGLVIAGAVMLGGNCQGLHHHSAVSSNGQVQSSAEETELVHLVCV